ncbi:MAG: Gfo/Idh/MocA family oxidoreductase [Candidatus Marinimicrobia bacterium]|nr:Gfo/Idh/MocA family oxidoreductase [Candidatus Neomarinimicrobiota bacterium]
MKIGIIGFGIRGIKMAKLINCHFPSEEIVAICDNRQKALKEAGNLVPSAILYSDFEAMLRVSEMEALLVETPAPMHGEFSIRAIEKGIHVLCDVPAVNDIQEAQRLWQAAGKTKRIFMLQSTTNFFGYVQKLEELYKRGKLGKPYCIESEYIHDLTELFGETPWREGYESIRYCTHSLGPVMKILKEPFREVVGFDTGSHVYNDPVHHDAMTAIFRTSSGVVMKLLVSFINHCPVHGHRFRVFGTKGYFERTMDYSGENSGKTYWYSTDNSAEKQFLDLEVGEAMPENQGRLDIGNHGGANFELLKSFFHAIYIGGPSPVGIKEALEMTLPGIYAAESACKNNAKLTIKYPWEI